MENEILDKMIKKKIKEYEALISKISHRVNSDTRISELGIACASGSIRAYKNMISSLKDLLNIACCENTLNNNWEEEVMRH